MYCIRFVLFTAIFILFSQNCSFSNTFERSTNLGGVFVEFPNANLQDEFGMLLIGYEDTSDAYWSAAPNDTSIVMKDVEIEALKAVKNPKLSMKENSDLSVMDANKLTFPINYCGQFGQVAENPNSYGNYDGKPILFPSGFFLSGYTNGVLWLNGALNMIRLSDYIPGTTNQPEGVNSMYRVNSSDRDFSSNWKLWKDAVALGADFYDGDGDGVYSPMDKNYNDKWDPDEDRPDISGDLMLWSAYNDGCPRPLRRFTDVKPQSIEIYQTIFASSKPDSMIDGTVFIRYTIVNKSETCSRFDSVYFSSAIDVDLGWYYDDLSGCDPILNAGYIYQATADSLLGQKVPAVSTVLLQGPPVFIPGKTFSDINSNAVYDPGIDIPRDTAIIRKGRGLAVKSIPGAGNLGMSSFTALTPEYPVRPPDTEWHYRAFQEGGWVRDGVTMKPCTYFMGNGSVLPDCNSINPRYFYSGSPITRQGWLNTYPNDQRMIVSTGPFTLKQNEPTDIIVALVVRNGNSGLESLSKTMESVKIAREIYNSNFSALPLLSDYTATRISPHEFSLSQNYPNPFNSATIINFTTASPGRVLLKVCDILGRTVRTLFDKEVPGDSYSVPFDASELPSGVYICRLEVDSGSKCIKLLHLK